MGNDQRGEGGEVWGDQARPVRDRSDQRAEAVPEIGDALGVLAPEREGLEDRQAVSREAQIAEARVSAAHPPPPLGARRRRTRAARGDQTCDVLATEHRRAGGQQPGDRAPLRPQPGQCGSLPLQGARDSLELDDHRLARVDQNAKARLVLGALSGAIPKLDRWPILDHEPLVHPRDHPSGPGRHNLTQ